MQPVEKFIYDENSPMRFNTIKRLETELEWIKLLQSASPLGFYDNIYQEGNISKMPDFDVFSLLEIRKRNADYIVKGKKEMTNVKDVLHKNQALPLITSKLSITKTSPCNEHPLTPHVYIVKLGFTGEYIIFLFLLLNIYCGYSLETPQ